MVMQSDRYPVRGGAPSVRFDRASGCGKKAEIAALQQALYETQQRRKTVIRAAALLLLPLFVFSTGAAPSGSWQRNSMEEVGALLIVLAVIGRAWCTLYIGGRKVERLVTTGPYSATRNPLYFFSFLAMAGLGTQTGSVILTLIAVATTYVIFMPVIRHEEAVLRQIHGVAFEVYYQTVPRLIPAMRRWIEPHRLEIDPILWRRTILDGMFFLLLIPLFRILGSIQESTPGFPLLRLF